MVFHKIASCYLRHFYSYLQHLSQKPEHVDLVCDAVVLIVYRTYDENTYYRVQQKKIVRYEEH